MTRGYFITEFGGMIERCSEGSALRLPLKGHCPHNVPRPPRQILIYYSKLREIYTLKDVHDVSGMLKINGDRHC
ncbi:MAG: hypothetical protein IJG36_10170, partial [Synergistaceae bacterium]|nr:hypothetical protein [Synergistaceae bacterium]